MVCPVPPAKQSKFSNPERKGDGGYLFIHLLFSTKCKFRQKAQPQNTHPHSLSRHGRVQTCYQSLLEINHTNINHGVRSGMWPHRQARISLREHLGPEPTLNQEEEPSWEKWEESMDQQGPWDNNRETRASYMENRRRCRSVTMNRWMIKHGRVNEFHGHPRM